MANEKNLIPFTSEQSHEEAVKNGKKGGIASGEARRQKKTIQKILDSFLDREIKDYPQMQKLAAKIGVKNEDSLKDLFTAVCLLNSLKDGNLGDLEKLVKLLGEDKQNEDNSVMDKLDKVLGEINKLAD